MSHFSAANRRPDQDRPDPCIRKDKLARRFGRTDQTRNDESNGGDIPPPGLSLEQEFQFSDEHGDEAESMRGAGKWSQISGGHRLRTVGFVIVASMRMNVDLPAPLGPSNPKIPGLISREKFFIPQRSVRYCFPRSVMVSFMMSSFCRRLHCSYEKWMIPLRFTHKSALLSDFYKKKILYVLSNRMVVDFIGDRLWKSLTRLSTYKKMTKKINDL